MIITCTVVISKGLSTALSVKACYFDLMWLDEKEQLLLAPWPITYITIWAFCIRAAETLSAEGGTPCACAEHKAHAPRPFVCATKEVSFLWAQSCTFAWKHPFRQRRLPVNEATQTSQAFGCFLHLWRYTGRSSSTQLQNHFSYRKEIGLFSCGCPQISFQLPHTEGWFLIRRNGYFVKHLTSTIHMPGC